MHIYARLQTSVHAWPWMYLQKRCAEDTGFKTCTCMSDLRRLRGIGYLHVLHFSRPNLLAALVVQSSGACHPSGAWLPFPFRSWRRLALAVGSVAQGESGGAGFGVGGVSSQGDQGQEQA